MTTDQQLGFVFSRDERGELSFVGNFDALYASIRDPWGQGSGNARMADYYAYSREALVSATRHLITDRERVRVLEVGCGHGHVTAKLAAALPQAEVHGQDISNVAIAEARRTFPNIAFRCADICERSPSGGPYDIIIWGELLWYVLHRLDDALANTRALLTPSGVLLVSQGFLLRQEYGSSVVDGLGGLMKYLIASSPGWGEIRALEEKRGLNADLVYGLVHAERR